MSELRNHLHRLADAHRATRYPRDLGEEMLARRNRAWRLWPLYPAAASIAAALLLAIFIHHRVTSTTPAPASSQSVSLAPAMSFQLDVPSGIDLAPSNITFNIPSATLVPSLDSQTDSDSSDWETQS